MSMPLSLFVTSYPSPSPYPQVHSLVGLCLYSGLATRFFMTFFFFFFSLRFHIYVLAYCICSSLSDLLHSVWQTVTPSTSLQITQNNSSSLSHPFSDRNWDCVRLRSFSSLPPPDRHNHGREVTGQADKGCSLLRLYSRETTTNALPRILFSFTIITLCSLLYPSSALPHLSSFAHQNRKHKAIPGWPLRRGLYSEETKAQAETGLFGKWLDI